MPFVDASATADSYILQASAGNAWFNMSQLVYNSTYLDVFTAQMYALVMTTVYNDTTVINSTLISRGDLLFANVSLFDPLDPTATFALFQSDLQYTFASFVPSSNQ